MMPFTLLPEAFLSSAITNAGLTPNLISGAQLVLIIARDTAAEIGCYEKSGRSEWRLTESPGVLPCSVGRNGISAHKREGDGCTPSGLFRLGFAFGNRAKPETKMAYREVTQDSFWVDDPSSRLYNSWAEGRDHADWKSAEHLADYPREYAYAAVIEYNTAERVPGMGSAVFLHCGERPTSGCVAVPEAGMLKILEWLDPEKAPVILINGA